MQECIPPSLSLLLKTELFPLTSLYDCLYVVSEELGLMIFRNSHFSQFGNPI